MSNKRNFQRLIDGIAQLSNGHTEGGEQNPADDNGVPQDQPEEDSGESGDSERARAGLFLPKNTFADDLAAFIPLIEERFNRDVVVQKCEDVPFERNLLMIVEGTHHHEQEMEEQLLRLSDCAEYAYTVSSMGTGYILWKLSDMGFTFNNTIDVVMEGHKTKPSNLTAEPRNTIISCVGKSVMEPPVIYTGHYASEYPYDDVLPKFAQTLGALLETDPGNKNFGYWAMGHRAIPISGHAGSQLSRAVQKTMNDESLHISPEQCTPWEPDQEIQFAGRINAFCIVPNNRDVRIDDERIQVIHTDCANAHLLKLRPLDAVWVEREVRHGAMDFLDGEIRDQSSLIHQVFRSHCRQFGKTDPISTWEMLREQHFDQHLPEIEPQEED